AGVRRKEVPFGHGAFYAPEGLPWLLCSYHPSRQNTQTGKLTPEMFDSIWQQAGRLLSREA
ncbi:MAG: uracil-DNA glycosylase, partial [Anaerolineaceae bacterium]